MEEQQNSFKDPFRQLFGPDGHQPLYNDVENR